MRITESIQAFCKIHEIVYEWIVWAHHRFVALDFPLCSSGKLAYFDYNYCVRVYFKRIQAGVYVQHRTPGRQEQLCELKVFLSMCERVYECVLAKASNAVV